MAGVNNKKGEKSSKGKGKDNNESGGGSGSGGGGKLKPATSINSRHILVIMSPFLLALLLCHPIPSYSNSSPRVYGVSLSSKERVYPSQDCFESIAVQRRSDPIVPNTSKIVFLFTCMKLSSVVKRRHFLCAFSHLFSKNQCEKHSKKEEALAKLREGVKFDEVAREFSEDKARQGTFPLSMRSFINCFSGFHISCVSSPRSGLPAYRNERE
jgi:hypothetical protein